jgi:hypothetical protein
MSDKLLRRDPPFDPETKDGRALDRLVHEARQGLEPRVSDAMWSAMEDRIVARMAAERSALVDEVNVASITARRRARVIQFGAAALAVAAAIAIFVRNEPGGALVDPQNRAQADLTAGLLRATEGPGEVRIGGLAARTGHMLRAGDVLEADGVRAVLERPRKVMWLLERAGSDASQTVARARVKSAGESLVVALEEGDIEAQVTPVPSGEAFAVDVATDRTLVRVAVHGTHLRVSRTGTRVAVDLTEGVVSIGLPPRTGSTYGTLVTAPSHVEFDAANLESTLKVDHAPASLRPAVPLVAHDPLIAVPNDVPAAPVRGPAAPVAPATVPRPVTAPVHDPDPSRIEPAGKPAISPREAIAGAVRDCAAARRRPENVRVTVTSKLKLKIGGRGDVETAQFDPPLLPEIQTCAAATIYKAKVEESAGGTVTIPIDFTY